MAWAPILGGLPAPEQRRLARSATVRAARRGQVLFRAGEGPEVLFLLLSGVVKIAVGSGAHSLPVALVGPGDLVGTSAVGDDRASAYDASAIDDSELVTLPGDALREVLSRQPEAMERLRAVLEARRNLAAAVAGNQGRLAAHGHGRVISVHSPRGGAGTTAIALTLAGALARDHPRNVALIDLSLPFNRCAFLGGWVPTTSLARIQQAPAPHREDVLLSGVCANASGVWFLAGALRPEESELVTPDLVAQAVQLLRREFAYVVIDVGTRVPALVRPLLERSDHVLMPMTPDLPALKDALSLLQSWASMAHRIRVVVNHTVRSPALDDKAIHRMLAVNAVTEIGYDRSLVEATEPGAILNLAATSSPMERCAVLLAREIASSRGEADGPEERPERPRRPRWTLS